MPILAAGSPDARQRTRLVDQAAVRSAQVKEESAQQKALLPGLPSPAGGFTLLELLVVLAIVAFASAGVGFALRDDGVARLERDALRLGALLEAARAQSQMTGVPIRWRITAQGFRFEPEPAATPDQAPPRQWLDADTRAEIERPPGDAPGTPLQGSGDSLLLGPDAIIAPQAVTLFASGRPHQHVRLASDGVRPFAVQADTP